MVARAGGTGFKIFYVFIMVWMKMLIRMKMFMMMKMRTRMKMLMRSKMRTQEWKPAKAEREEPQVQGNVTSDPCRAWSACTWNHGEF